MYAILGATGNTGRPTAEALLARGEKLRVVLRDAAKGEVFRRKGAEVRAADVDDPDGLAAALEGVEGAYLLIPPPYAAPDFLATASRIGANLAEAARRASVPHVVALSSVGAHQEAGAIASLTIFERHLREAGLNRTILRPVYFMSNWGGIAPLAREQGIAPSLFQPLDRPQPMISTDDIGEAAAEALLSPVVGERIINLAGPADYSPADVAAAFAAKYGRAVEAVAPPREAWRGILEGAGLSPAYAEALGVMYDGLNAGTIGFPPGEPVRRTVHNAQGGAGADPVKRRPVV